MKTILTKNIRSFLIVCMLTQLIFSSCENNNDLDEVIDSEKPTIVTVSPISDKNYAKNNDDQYFIQLETTFKDNVALKSYKIEIRSNNIESSENDQTELESVSISGNSVELNKELILPSTLHIYQDEYSLIITVFDIADNQAEEVIPLNFVTEDVEETSMEGIHIAFPRNNSFISMDKDYKKWKFDLNVLAEAENFIKRVEVAMIPIEFSKDPDNLEDFMKYLIYEKENNSKSVLIDEEIILFESNPDNPKLEYEDGEYSLIVYVTQENGDRSIAVVECIKLSEFDDSWEIGVHDQSWFTMNINYPENSNNEIYYKLSSSRSNTTTDQIDLELDMNIQSESELEKLELTMTLVNPLSETYADLKYNYVINLDDIELTGKVIDFSETINIPINPGLVDQNDPILPGMYVLTLTFVDSQNQKAYETCFVQILD